MVTLLFARYRPKRTSCDRCPPPSRRRHTLECNTNAPSSAAPLYRGVGPRNDLTTYLRTSRHSGLPKVPQTESHCSRGREASERILSHSVSPRCVHALARKRG